MASVVLILGAAGRVGQVLTTAFADAGWSVRAQARKPLPSALAAHPRVQAIRCDAFDRDALREAARGAQMVIHALNPLYTEWHAAEAAGKCAQLRPRDAGTAEFEHPGTR